MQIYLQPSEKERQESQRQNSSKQVRKPWYQLKKQLRLKVVKKDYERFYERVFSFDRADPTFVKLYEGFSFPGFEKNQDFYDAYAEAHRKLHMAFWDAAIQITWLRARVRFKGKKSSANFVNIVRPVENTTPSMVRMRVIDPYLKKYTYYFEELFPDFHKKDPRKHPDYYKFPFKFISPVYLLVVAEMESERMFLLKNAEDRRMSYAAFLDYVANFVLCCNQELGQDVFNLVEQPDGTFRVSDVTRKRKH